MTTRDKKDNLYDSVSEPTDAAQPAPEPAAGQGGAAPVPDATGTSTPAGQPAASAQPVAPAAPPAADATAPLTQPGAQPGPRPASTDAAGQPDAAAQAAQAAPAATDHQAPGFHPGFGAVPAPSPTQAAEATGIGQTKAVPFVSDQAPTAQTPAGQTPTGQNPAGPAQPTPAQPATPAPGAGTPAPAASQAPGSGATGTQPVSAEGAAQPPARQFPTSMAGTVPPPPAPVGGRGVPDFNAPDAGPRPGFMTAAELAARDGAPGSVAATGQGAASGEASVPAGSATPSFLRTTSDSSTERSQQVTNEASSAAASVSSMPNMPVVAASTVFGADLSHNSSARDDMADTATQKPVIDTAAANRERKAREEAARIKQEEAAQRARERAARERRLGTVAQQPQEPLVIEKPQGPSTDKFAPALGLFLMRLVTAVIIGVYGYQMLTERQPVVDALVSIGIPRAGMVTWGLSVLLLVMAVMFVFGFGARVAGALTTVLAGLTIAFYRWGDFNPFVAGTAGFSGDIELLLAGIGLVFLLVGAGGWSLDGGIRRSRVRRKQEAEF
ncbi:hypothetical protein FAM19024_002123 [Propionibacterium freudenreichii]|uniref:hypothetical protein n=1 Tax=Propionibacterium freudenreichii TaxID=1744 RepID=UPI002434497C|nr:hypothetical protein [Propionibacterium freudenreichii]WFF32624.1 hypothetical protein FAM19024_002123 [Propionibacterium freudenreichii]